MKISLSLSLCMMGLLGLTAQTAFGDQPLLIFDPLPKPLKLPPGLVETLPLNNTASFFGDAIRAVDCIDPAEQRFGICGNQLFGGVVMSDSHLSGNITIQFYPAIGNIAHFVVYQGVIKGDDTTISAPLGYNAPNKYNQIADALQISSGDLDLTNGYAQNIQWYVNFANSSLLNLGNVNPKLARPVINFPGTRGHAWASFTQRPDGLLDFYFRGSTFLPLGADTQGDPVRFPLPFCGPTGNCASVLARGTSLHPHLYLDTRQDLGFTPCGSNCPDIPTDKTQIFTVNARYTNFGDDFDLHIPQQGGLGPGRSELQGRFEIQFGSKTGNTVPFKISAMVPEGLFAEPPASPLLGNGFRGFLMGPNQQLHFPNQLYNQHKLLFVDEPFNFAQGMIDLTSGRIIGEFEYPMYIDQSIIEALIPDNNGRVSSDPFFLISMRAPQNPDDTNYAFFEKTASGQTMFRANTFHHRSFETYCFPQPSLLPGICWIAPAEANLNIFGKLQAAHLPTSAASIVKADRRTFTSSVGDTFTYNVSVNCNAPGGQSTFVYSNGNSGTSGGTFTLTSAASISCTNSRVSTAAAGDYDQVAITGFGIWSKDPFGSLPRFMAASVSMDPANPYALIQVFSKVPGEYQTLPGDEIDVNLSTAENKPPTKPTP